MNVSYIANLRQSSRKLIQELGFLENQFAHIGSYSQCHALLALEKNKTMTGKELSNLLNLEKSSTSRLIKELDKKKYCKFQADPQDSRVKLISLTKKGNKAVNEINSKADNQVISALEVLNEKEKEQVLNGLYLYAKALKISRIQSDYSIRKLKKIDIKSIIDITKKTWAEFGFYDSHEHTHIYEEELNTLMQYYQSRSAQFYVIASGDCIVGGGGFRQIGLTKDKTCELQNMYFLPSIRGLGLGSMLLRHILIKATQQGFKNCYLETMSFMHSANALYQKNGFILQKKPRFSTGHVWTDRWYLKKLVA